MAKIVTPLTNTQVKQARPRDKLYKLADGEGLQLRVMPNGSKQWLLDYYKPISKARSSLSLGSYPEVSLADARKRKIAARELLADGKDPKLEKEQQQRADKLELETTLMSVAQTWFEVKKTRIAESTATSLWRNFQNHVFPKLANHPISQINAPETIAVLKPLAAKGSLETTNKVIRHLNEVMVFAVNTGVIHHNPLAGIKAAFETPKQKNLPALKPSELPELMNTLAYASIKITTRCLIEWQLHTITRASEAAGVKWEEIDFDNRVWVIPAERMKMKREHIVPLTLSAIKILERMKPISGHREYVFPSDRHPNEPSNPQTANAALKRMGFKNRLVAHGMRSIASTAMNERGLDADLIEASLAHVDKNEVRRAYNRTDYIERRRPIMEWWSGFIVQASKTI
ncbi:integrase domain-containing protein [Pseudoalteromonas sp. T1lg88]|uniref:integrase domain-containing protein n=1 Tax=Pseudoalteromonas sp. T1lg88 TaxID=2077104 RepID=UPI000CF62FF8|nr:integrase domain-containing protein [Pseudoalteromonas sp. T1lg88]